MKKQLKVSAAVLAIISSNFSKDGQEKQAKAAFTNALQTFTDDMQQEIVSLKEEKAILLVEKAEAMASHKPSQSAIMRLEKQLREANLALENQWQELEEAAVSEIARVAIAKQPTKPLIRQLVRVLRRDTTLNPVVTYVTAVSIAEKALEVATKDSNVTKIENSIKAIDAKIVELEAFIA